MKLIDFLNCVTQCKGGRDDTEFHLIEQCNGMNEFYLGAYRVKLYDRTIDFEDVLAKELLDEEVFTVTALSANVFRIVVGKQEEIFV